MRKKWSKSSNRGKVKNRVKNKSRVGSCAVVRVRPMLLVALIAVLVTAMSSFLYYKIKMIPNVEEIAQIRAKALVNRTVNKALNDQFSGKTDIKKLLIMKKDKDGSIEMVQSDTKAVNLLITGISDELQQSFTEMKGESMSVPLGTLIGSLALSQTGPSVNLKIIPISVSETDFRTEFEAKGINQTKYKIYMLLKSKIKIIAPFSASTFTVKNTVLIAEAVILGNVPSSYVQVPKEDILDVTDE